MWLPGHHMVSMWKSCGVLWKPCNVHIKTMWCPHLKPCGVHLETTWYLHGFYVVITLYLLGNHMMSMWKPCGIHMETMWFSHGNHMISFEHHVVSMWTQHGYNVDTMWFPGGHHIISMWTPCGFQVETRSRLNLLLEYPCDRYHFLADFHHFHATSVGIRSQKITDL